MNVINSLNHILSGRETLRKTIVAFFWMGSDQAVNLVGIFVLSVLLARLLGPSEYGYYSYIFAFVSIFIPLSAAGLPTLAIKEFSQNADRKSELFGSMLFIQTVASLSTVLISSGVMWFIRPQDIQSQLLVMILMFGLSFQSGELVESWFRAKLQLRQVTLIKITLISLFLCIKTLALLLTQSVTVIIVLAAIETMTRTILMYTYLKLSHQISRLHISIPFIKSLLFQAIPIVISGLAIMIYAKADFLFLQYFLGSSMVAQYAVALGIVEVLSVIPFLMMKTITPVLLSAAKDNFALFQHHLLNVYRIMFVASAGLILLTWIIVAPLVPFVYGSEYNVAMSILVLLSIRLIFTHFGLARSVVVNHEGVFYFDLFTNIVGAGLNVAGNILLIPLLGWQGAIVASLVSLFVSTFFLDIFHPKLRNNLKLQLKAIISPHQIRLTQVQ